MIGTGVYSGSINYGKKNIVESKARGLNPAHAGGHGDSIRLTHNATEKKKFSILAACETFDKNYKRLRIVVRGADRVLGPSRPRSKGNPQERIKAQRKQ